MIRIALMGGGLMGREHALRLPQVDGCRLHSVCDPGASGGELAQAQGVPWHRSLDELLTGPLPDAAIVATPNDLHVPQALALVRRGVPVLVEKPVAVNLDEGQDLVRAVEHSGVPVLVGHHRRHGAVVSAAHACVRGGDLGPLVAVNATVLFHKPAAYFAAAPWRSQPGGGPILINLVHEIDTLRHLAGDIVAVQACSARATRGGAVEDSAAVILEFAGGALGTLLLSDCAAAVRSWEQTSGENPAYARSPDQDCIFLAGTRGSLALPTLERWHVSGPEGSWYEPMVRERLRVTEVDPLLRQLAHFAQVVRGRAEPLVSVADALASLRTTLGIHRAAAQGQRVAV